MRLGRAPHLCGPEDSPFVTTSRRRHSFNHEADMWLCEGASELGGEAEQDRAPTTATDTAPGRASGLGPRPQAHLLNQNLSWPHETPEAGVGGGPPGAWRGLLPACAGLPCSCPGAPRTALRAAPLPAGGGGRAGVSARASDHLRAESPPFHSFSPYDLKRGILVTKSHSLCVWPLWNTCHRVF